MGTALLTQSMSFRKARKTNSTVAAFSARTLMGTTPLLDTDAGSATAQVAIDRTSGQDGPTQNLLKVLPYAIGGDNLDFGVRVYGWRKLGNHPDTMIWVPILLADLECVTSARAGLTGRLVGPTERFADTITITDGLSEGVQVYSPANDTPGFALVDLLGCQMYELEFELGVSVTSMNALVAEL